MKYFAVSSHKQSKRAEGPIDALYAQVNMDDFCIVALQWLRSGVGCNCRITGEVLCTLNAGGTY